MCVLLVKIKMAMIETYFSLLIKEKCQKKRKHTGHEVGWDTLEYKYKKYIYCVVSSNFKNKIE